MLQLLIYHEKGLGCAQTCHRGAAEPNPWYGRLIGDQQPNYGDPVAGQTNRYLATTPNSCPNPNELTSQLDTDSGYLSLLTPAGDITAAPSSPPGPFDVQASTQNQYYPGAETQATNSLGLKEANVMIPNTATKGAPNTADTFTNLFPITGTNYLNLDQLGNADNTVIGSGAGTTITTPSTGALLPSLGNGITTIGTTAGTTTEGASPETFNFATLANFPLFRKRDAKSARDFRL